MIQPYSTKNRGQSLVEFALAVPLLLFLSVMIIDFGRVIYYYSAIHNAAREGVRYGSVHNEESTSWVGMKLEAKNKAIGVNLTDANFAYFGWGPDEPNGNHTVQMTINYPFTPVTPLVGNLLSGGVITLVSDAKMRTEYDKPGP